jgi:hypothetical protein
MITMTLCGLWHGAGWGFVLWGVLTGIGLVVSVAWRESGKRMGPAPGWALNIVFFMLTLIVFRAENMASRWSLLQSAFGLHGLGGASLPGLWPLAAGALVSVFGPTSQEIALTRLRPRWWIAVPAGAALVFLFLWIGGRFENAFIYFQF